MPQGQTVGNSLHLDIVDVTAECISDLNTNRTALLGALDAGCDDLVACAASSCCPLSFAELAEPMESVDDHAPLKRIRCGSV